MNHLNTYVHTHASVLPVIRMFRSPNYVRVCVALLYCVGGGLPHDSTRVLTVCARLATAAPVCRFMYVYMGVCAFVNV